MNKYRTGAICLKHEIKSNDSIKGKYFKFSFDKKENKQIVNGYELIIDAISIEKAQQSFELFIAALTLNLGHSYTMVYDMPYVYQLNLIPLEAKLKNNFENVQMFCLPGIYDAAIIAARASFSRKLYYSLYKYLLACNMHSNNIMDIDPSRSDYCKLPRNPLHHIRYAYAIFILYSILEELDLTIPKFKRALDNNRCWVPEIKLDIENRLIKFGVDLSKKASWNLRSNKPSKIHKATKLKLQTKEAWARYAVRDSEIEIIDAIYYLKWLRNDIIAHKLGDEFLSISIYDVANANFLIRQILFDRLKYKTKN